MSDRLYPMELDALARWIRDEWSMRQSIFGIGHALFFTPSESDPFRTAQFGHLLDTPIGVAAGPHTQLAPNIIAAWLCGSRFIELKTVQTLDQLEVSKPCIDMQDTGYNVEWSQELRLPESTREYVHAWVLIHALHHLLGHPGERPGTVFNLSVGYNLEGIRKPNVQAFLATMRDASTDIAAARAVLDEVWSDSAGWTIPNRISDNVTLSTMHGCPPAEIGTISRYLLEEQGLHTYVKLNPTLLGPDRLRALLNDTLGYRDIVVPDEAFGHDIRFEDAVGLIRELREVAARCGLRFGIKLSNTLEVRNHRRVFAAHEKQMYLSGRPLHAITVHVAHRLQEAFDGELDVSFAGGADAFNLPDLMACGMNSVTVCSDLLRSGGYTRQAQYLHLLREAIEQTGADNLDDFILARAGLGSVPLRQAARANLATYAERVSREPAYHAATYDRAHTKSMRPLGRFDCIKAPCTEACPVEQDVPHYMRFVKAGRFDDAARVVRRDNTMPCILGRACHHPCQPRCVRTHLDQPVAIREIKRFIMDQATVSSMPAFLHPERIAIVGSGPCGLAAADFLSRAGYPVTVFDARDREGGMVANSIPGYRASDAALDKDLAFLQERGIEVRHHQRGGVDFDLDSLRRDGFAAIVLAVGAQQAGTLDTGGRSVHGLWDSLSFLRACREGRAPEIGNRVGIVGGGDVAMDCARTAWRLGAEDVAVIYRRTRDEMPAQYDEVHGLIAENIPVRELRAPLAPLDKEGVLTGLRCAVMELGEPDASGRRRPRPVPGQTEDIPLDTVIVAINQSGDFDWLTRAGIALNDHGYILTDPETLATSRPGVYAGGDAIGDGPATIVKALGDGKRIAQAIRRQFEGTIEPEPPVSDLPPAGRFDLQVRRAQRIAPVQIPERPADRRRDFDEVVQTLDITDARAEAARCLDCDQLCSYCVGVCPNLALFTYDLDPLEVTLPTGFVKAGRWMTTGGTTIAIRQPHQVAVLADFCNECGNCTTFCPSAGRPYRDKPRLYRTAHEFEQQSDNAFMMVRLPNADREIRGRYQGTTHRLLLGSVFRYTTPLIEAAWSERWELLAIAGRDPQQADAITVDLAPVVELAAIALGLRESMPFFPLPKVES
ncbi:MAG TPA: FAD-dependent oxidoreductase [Kiritimatiellia bacterium]|nr:FAD-dependent oxidoreductase [Kiritimatiellia bacterium]HMP35665.1 FAD-dependent oxidoreductase [Kiritimatiellia bacterium]